MLNFELKLPKFKEYIREKFEVEATALELIDNVICYLHEESVSNDWSDRMLAEEIFRALFNGSRIDVSLDEILENLIGVIYQSEELIVKTTGRDYDFIATMEIADGEFSRDYEALKVTFTDDYEYIEPIIIQPSDWIGIEANESGYDTIQAIKDGKFITQWVDDIEEE
jgi:hypothetical protein